MPSRPPCLQRRQCMAMTSLCSDSGFLDALMYSCPPAAVKCTVGMFRDPRGLAHSKDFSLSCSSSCSCCVLRVRHLPEPQKWKPVSNRISSGWQPSPASTCDLGPPWLWPLCLISHPQLSATTFPSSALHRSGFLLFFVFFDFLGGGEGWALRLCFSV